MKLRYAVFYREFQNKKFPFGLDIDQFDHLADHLVIVDKRINKIVGTYRLISSAYSNTFYSQSEFENTEFIRSPGLKLELSRACIQKNYRTGAVMNLLWRGIAQYLQDTGSMYLFGCASIRTMDMHETACVYRHLQELGAISNEYNVHPVGEYVMDGFPEYVETLPYNDQVKEIAKGLIPPLFQSYLRMGAHGYGLPALDRDFRCVDFFTVLRVENLKGLYEKKYMS